MVLYSEQVVRLWVHTRQSDPSVYADDRNCPVEVSTEVVQKLTMGHTAECQWSIQPQMRHLYHPPHIPLRLRDHSRGRKVLRTSGWRRTRVKQ